jgi:hypothetical protein
MSKRELGKVLIRSVAVFTVIGGFVADWNRTHLFNPNWTPHAKFHDAMTISLGVCLGVTSLILLGINKETTSQNLKLAALLPGFFYFSMAASFLFPGARGLESEFPELVPKIAGIYCNELFGALFFLAVLAIAYQLAIIRPTRE